MKFLPMRYKTYSSTWVFHTLLWKDWGVILRSPRSDYQHWMKISHLLTWNDAAHIIATSCKKLKIMSLSEKCKLGFHSPNFFCSLAEERYRSTPAHTAGGERQRCKFGEEDKDYRTYIRKPVLSSQIPAWISQYTLDWRNCCMSRRRAITDAIHTYTASEGIDLLTQYTNPGSCLAFDWTAACGGKR